MAWMKYLLVLGLTIVISACQSPTPDLRSQYSSLTQQEWNQEWINVDAGYTKDPGSYLDGASLTAARGNMYFFNRTGLKDVSPGKIASIHVYFDVTKPNDFFAILTLVSPSTSYAIPHVFEVFHRSTSTSSFKKILSVDQVYPEGTQDTSILFPSASSSGQINQLTALSVNPSDVSNSFVQFVTNPTSQSLFVSNSFTSYMSLENQNFAQLAPNMVLSQAAQVQGTTYVYPNAGGALVIFSLNRQFSFRSPKIGQCFTASDLANDVFAGPSNYIQATFDQTEMLAIQIPSKGSLDAMILSGRSGATSGFEPTLCPEVK